MLREATKNDTLKCLSAHSRISIKHSHAIGNKNSSEVWNVTINKYLKGLTEKWGWPGGFTRDRDFNVRIT